MAIIDDISTIGAHLRQLERQKEPPAPPIVTNPTPPEHIPDFPGQFDTTPDPWGFEGFCC